MTLYYWDFKYANIAHDAPKPEKFNQKPDYFGTIARLK